MSVVWCKECGCGPMDADEAEWGVDDEAYCDEHKPEEESNGTRSMG